MKLVLKSLARSVRRSPAQSLVLIFTLFLATAVFVVSFVLTQATGREQTMRNESLYGKADLSVTLSVSSPSRFLTATALREQVGEDDVVGGYYALPVSVEGEQTVWGVAADFYTIDRLFDFPFTDYGSVTDGTVNTSVFISRPFALSRGLKTGDSFTVKLLSTKKQYTVQGISAYPFFGQYDFLINASGAIGILAAQVPALAAFDGNNLPYSALFVRLAEEGRATALAGQLRRSPDYAGQIIAVHGQGDTDSYAVRLLGTVQTVMMALSVCIVTVIVYCSVNIMARKRAEETESLLLVGVPPRMAAVALVMEMAVYLIFGGALGVSASAIILRAVQPAIGFVYAPLRLSVGGALFGVAAVVFVAYAALSFQIAAGNRARRGRSALFPAIALLLTVVPCICLIFTPVRLHYIFAFCAGVALIVLMLGGVPYVMNRGFLRLGGAVDGHVNSAPLRYAVKNTARVKELHNACRLLCVVLTAVIGMTACFGYGNRQLEVSRSLLDCNYVAINASEASQAAIENLPATQGCAWAYFSTDACFADGTDISLVSVDNAQYIAAEYAPQTLPQGDGLLLPRSIAALHGVGVGDPVTVTLGGKDYEFTLSGVTDGASYYGYFDSRYFGLPRNVLLIRAQENSAAYEAELSEILSADLALIATPDKLMQGQERFVVAFLGALAVFFVCNVLLSAVEVVNLIWFGYARRRREFSDYALCGMTPSEIKRMIACEMSLFFLLALVVSAAGGGIVCALIDRGMASFGFTLF